MAVTRLPRSLRTLLTAAFVSYLGSGLTLPFLFIYLHQVRGISIGVSGLLISGTALLSVPVGPVAGAIIDRYGPRLIAVGTTAIQITATTSLVFVHSAVSALIPMVLFGLAQGSWPAWSALLAIMVEEEQQPKVFSFNFQLLNLGLGIGAVISGIAIHVSQPASFVAIYFADAATDLVIVAALLALPASAYRRARAISPAVGGSTEAVQSDGSGVASGNPVVTGLGGYRQVLADKRMVRYLIVAVVLGIAGYGALGTGAVAYATTDLHVSSRGVAWAFGANTAFIVLFQPIGLRIAQRMRRTKALQIVALFFASCWVVLLLGGVWNSRLLSTVLLVISFTIFAMGEVLLSPVFGPLVNEFAPPELVGRYNALSSWTFSLAAVISPALAGPMIGAGLGRGYLVVLLGCCGVAVLGFAWLRVALTDSMDRAPAEVVGVGDGPPAVESGAQGSDSAAIEPGAQGVDLLAVEPRAPALVSDVAASAAGPEPGAVAAGSTGEERCSA